MKAKLTLRERWACLWGKPCVANHRTKEIHRLRHKHVNCLPIARKNRQFVTEVKALLLIAENGFNGCRWCWAEKDEG